MALRLHILGSSSAYPAHGRNQSAQYLAVGKSRFLIDCGEGTQLTLIRHRINFHKLDAIFISHLHGDHFFGLIGLLSSMSLTGRVKALQLYGPAPLWDLLDAQLKATGSVLHYPIDFVATTTDGPTELLRTPEGVVVSSVPLSHGIPCTGFLFRFQPQRYKLFKKHLPEGLRPDELQQLSVGRDLVTKTGEVYVSADEVGEPVPSFSYAYCSDTRFTPESAPTLAGVDLLYHEATFAEEHAQRAHETFHSTAAQAAEFAQLAGAKHLIIGHFSTRYKSLSKLLNEARAVFPNTSLAIEDEVFDLP